MQRGRCELMYQALWPEQLAPAAWAWLRLLRLSRHCAAQRSQERAGWLAGSCLRRWLSGPAVQPLQTLLPRLDAAAAPWVLMSLNAAAAPCVLQRSAAAAAPWVPQHLQHGQEGAAERACCGWGLLWCRETSRCEGVEAGSCYSHQQPCRCWLQQLPLHSTMSSGSASPCTEAYTKPATPSVTVRSPPRSQGFSAV